MDTIDTLGAKIRRSRRDKEMSQDELAQKVGVTQSTLCTWENSGKDIKIRVRELLLLARALEKPLTYFLE